MEYPKIGIVAVIIAIIAGLCLLKVEHSTEHSIFIEASPKDVFEFVYDHRNMPKIHPFLISCEASNYWTSPDGKEENAKWTMLERVPGLDWMDNSFDAYVTADRNDMLIAFRYSIYYLIKGHFLWSFEAIEAHRSDQGIAGTIVKQAGDLKIAR
ncbi:unnamed protein product, partial [Owenia fusiformis]